MNFKLLIISLGLCFFNNLVKANNRELEKLKKITIEVEFPSDFNRSLVKLQTAPFEFVVFPAWRYVKPENEGNLFKWTIVKDGYLIADLTSILGKGTDIYICESGDSIRIDLKSGKPIYSGKGAEKFKMLQLIAEKEQLLLGPKVAGYNASKRSAMYYQVNSLQDYFAWSRYLDNRLELMDNVYESYRKQINPYIYDYLKADRIQAAEYERLMKFGDLVNTSVKLKISGKELANIFDSTAKNKHVKWLHSYTGRTRWNIYLYDFVRRSILRKYNFDANQPIFKTAKRKVAYAELAKEIYTGYPLQECLTYIVTRSGLKEHVFTESGSPEIEQLLLEFYAMSGYPEYKEHVREYEQMIREWVISSGHLAPDFSLADSQGKLVNKKDLAGKLVVISFLDESKESLKTIAVLKKVQQALEGNHNVLFVNISMEKNKEVWKRSLTDPATEVKGSTNLYTNGLGKDHPVLKYYNVKAYPEFSVSAFPRIFVLDRKGKFIFNGEFMRAFSLPLKRITQDVLPDPTKDEGTALINDIYKELAFTHDGPYVFHRKDGITTYSIESSKLTTQQYPFKSSTMLTAQTDDLRLGNRFNLKSQLLTEPSLTITRPERLFVLSDIEGNFDAFRKLLQANKIVDDNLNWTFGKGRLVFAGDMFDRGLQVTECLWLVYTLEEKAKAAGGYVHFILGNHEIMNLQGDHRYVEDKYKENAKLMDKTLTQLYNEDSELGRWLRTKNIIEKIGDLLFMHGGFSKELNNQPLSVEQLNSTARPFYADNKAAKNANPKVSQLYNSTTSPFWYRLYYEKERFSKSQNKQIYRAPESQVDSTLRKFDVKHIITGHTIIADTISTHYNNKIINTDTKHAEGKSEALLIEGKNFYRVNAEGKRVLLFRDEEK